MPIAECEAIDGFDCIIIGASIRYGRHKQEVHDFIARHCKLLAEKENAFFSVNIVARKPTKCQPETNPYLRNFLKKITWRPNNLVVFAGRLDYPRCSYFDRMMIRFIMLITNGPTDPTAVVEFTDWNQVDAFARLMGEKLYSNSDPTSS
jgi:menaquinone-dependent protoporphyrinogen oxidase